MEPLVIAYLALLCCLLGTVAASVWLRNMPALGNALVSLGVTIVPPLTPVVAGSATWPVVDVAPLLSVWLATAGLVHTIGMFGPYDTIWWWDHVTHVLSATLLAALVYAILLTADPTVAGFSSGPVTLFGGTLLVTVALGVVWEFLEIGAREYGEARGAEPILEYYGLRDTGLDLVFDAVGAGIVVLLDLRLFEPLVEDHADLAATLLGAIVGVGFLATIAVTIWVQRRT